MQGGRIATRIAQLQRKLHQVFSEVEELLQKLREAGRLRKIIDKMNELRDGNMAQQFVARRLDLNALFGTVTKADDGDSLATTAISRFSDETGAGALAGNLAQRFATSALGGPAVWGWACADSPERAAARASESLNAGKHFCWLVCTDQRFAVVVEADAQAEARRQVERAAEPSGRLGGLFGKGKQREEPARPLETGWQYPLDQGIDFAPAELGRAADPVEFVRVRFADDSTLDFRMLDAADLVATVRERLR